MLRFFMKSRFKYSLQRTMIIYFLLIGVASLLVGFEFIIDTHREELSKELLSSIGKYSNNEIKADQVLQPVARLRNKAILMVAIIMFVMVVVLTMFIKNITDPLQHMIETSREISRGDLSCTINICSNNELAELGSVINEMSSNLQEIILLSKNLCSSGNDFAGNILAILKNRNLRSEDIIRIKEETTCFKTELESLNQVVDDFNFYTVENSFL
ncbi:MAG: hypothetical protein DRH24_06785 [Deltaproteobacteria bacterium]|nr:MAG: hypothetical protein DRH24_06785 [Deltaproteobacteria bacterium]